MKLETTRFGEIEVQDEDVHFLPSGLIGFPECKKFAVLQHDKDSPFLWLQSLEEGSIAFVVLDPLIFCPTYMAEVTEREAEDLGLKEEGDALVCVIITMPTNPQNMTANLKAPLVFNKNTKTGRQIILSNPAYHTRHNVMHELRKQLPATDLPQQTPSKEEQETK